MRWPRRRRESQLSPAEQTGSEPTETGRADTGVVPEQVLVHLHVPKSGGTAVREWLERVLAPGLISPERHRLPAKLSADQAAGLAPYRVFSGHFDIVDADNFPGPQVRFTLLREPVEQLVSLYDFWRAFEPAYAAENNLVEPPLAAAMTFDEFVGDPHPLLVPALDNTVVRTFAGLIRTNDPIADPDAALAKAIGVLESFDHVGHMRQVEDTADWLRSVLGLPPGAGGPVDRSNVRGEWSLPFLRNVERTVPSPEAIAALEPLVYLDRALFEHFTAPRA